MSAADCARFREQVEELVLGGLDGPTRTSLLEHAAACPACQAAADQLALVADRLLLAVPEIGPPAGFESRVLERLTPSSVPATRRRTRWRPFVAVAAVASLLAAASLALVYNSEHSGNEYPQAAQPPVSGPAPSAVPRAVRSGTIVRADGSRVGTVSLVDQPRPLVLITIERPRASNNVVTCELVSSGGAETPVGTWNYDDVAKGAWAVGIDPALLDSVRMNVRDAGGTILASAPLA